MTTVDLDKLEALEKRATRGEWKASAYHMAAYGAQISDADIRFIVAVRNAFPELVREVRELRVIAEAARDVLAEMDATHSELGHGACSCDKAGPCDTAVRNGALAAALARYDAGGTQLRTQLEQARKGLEEIERIVTTTGGPQLHMIVKIRDAIARALSGEGSNQ